MQRVNLIPLDSLLSSYKKKNSSERYSTAAFKGNCYVAPDMAEALINLNEIISQNAGELYITDLLRTWEKQQEVHNNWKIGKQKAYAAVPGSSLHQAGRAVDFSMGELNFKNIPKENWVKKFWDIAKPLGFKPIIKIPSLGVSENWHFDYPGKDWEHLYDYMDQSKTDDIDYSLVAKCCILDAGLWRDPADSKNLIINKTIQSQVYRLRIL